jgi:hypothetical protein
VEKATWHDQPFRRTHDLVELGATCVVIAPVLEAHLRGTAPLTEYAWRYRYPGDPSDPEESEVRQALDRARAVAGLIQGLLPSEAHP